ncbi:MAG: polysaccharide lyase [Agriterribacter sp.]
MTKITYILTVASLFALIAAAPAIVHNNFAEKLFITDSFEASNWLNNWEGSEVPAGSFIERSDSFAVDGTYSLRFESNKNGTTNRRTEILAGVETSINIDRVYEFSLYIPNYYRRDSVDDTINQLHDYPDFSLGEDYRSPAISIRIRQDSFYCVILSAAAPVNTNLTLDSNRSFNLGPIFRGQWMRWKLRARLSYVNTGITQIWRNDTLVLDKTGYANYYNDIRGPYAKFGIYTPDWGSVNFSSVVTQKVLYFDNISITRLVAGREVFKKKLFQEWEH